MTEEAVEDERDIELSSIQAIYPELKLWDGEPRKATIDLKVAPSTGLRVTFTPPLIARSYDLPAAAQVESEVNEVPQPEAERVVVAETHSLGYLPPLQLELVLPCGYPEHAPPTVYLRVDPPWVPEKIQERLCREIRLLWEEYGYSQVVFAYIDFLQQEAEAGFRLTSDLLVLPHELKAPLLEYDRTTKREAFETETFDCGVCLEPKKGSSCYRMHHCGHVFCIGCLQDFYNNAITEGDVTTVRCLNPDCGKVAGSNKRKRHRTLHPRELLEIDIDRAQAQRYVDLKLKKKLDSDNTTIFCPRRHCQAPARSAKYAKYTTASLETYPDSDSEVSDSDAASPTGSAISDAPTSKPSYDPNDRLAICSSSKCAYAFCRVCLKSWHGDLLSCRPPNSKLSQLSPEELASYDYIRLHTSPCPTCNSPAQKTHGCNHMICATCSTHFCYLCSFWLPAGNPYKHFNTPGTTCYMLLWELEAGDEGDRAAGERPDGVFAGPRAAEQAQIFAAMLERDEVGQQGQERAQDAPNVPAPAPAPPRPQQRQHPANQPAQAQVLQLQPQVPPAQARAPAAPARRALRGRAPRAVDPGLQRFLELAANDEEDGWDSDEMDVELLPFEMWLD